jgi:hypothetical protein
VWHATQASKRKRRSKALPVLGAAAGLSLSLASGASAAPGRPAANMLTRNTLVSHEITLREEEVSDVSLATFYAVNKENAGTFRPRIRFAMGGGCGACGTAFYEASTLGSDANLPHRSIKPAQRYTHALKRNHVPKNP